MNPVTVSVRVKSPEKRLTKSHLIYEDFKVDSLDPIVKSLIDDAVQDFKDTDEELKITVTAKLEVQ